MTRWVDGCVARRVEKAHVPSAPAHPRMDVVGLAKDFEDLSDAPGLPDSVGGDYDGVPRVAGMHGGVRALI